MHSMLETCYVQIMGVRVIKPFWGSDRTAKVCMRISIFPLSIYNDEAFPTLYVLFLLFFFVCASIAFAYCN